MTLVLGERATPRRWSREDGRALDPRGYKSRAYRRLVPEPCKVLSIPEVGQGRAKADCIPLTASSEVKEPKWRGTGNLHGLLAGGCTKRGQRRWQIGRVSPVARHDGCHIRSANASFRRSGRAAAGAGARAHSVVCRPCGGHAVREVASSAEVVYF